MTELPPAGWYDDPTSPVQERWWDGEKWSEQTRRKVVEENQHQPGDLRRISDFLGHTFGLIRARWDDFLLVGAIAAILTAIAAVGLLRPVVDAIDIVDDRVVGFEFSQFLWLFLFVVVAALIGAAVTLAQYRIAWEAAIDESGTWATTLLFGITNTPRLIAWGLLGVAPIILGFVTVVMLAPVDSFVSGLLVFALTAGFIWWLMVLVFLPVALVAIPRGANPIVSAMSVVKRRWWRIFGRILLLGIIVGLVMQVIGAIFAQIAGTNLFGFELIDAGNGRIDVVKNLGNPLEFLVGGLVFWLLSYVGNSGQVAGYASIAFDVMPRPETESQLEPY